VARSTARNGQRLSASRAGEVGDKLTRTGVGANWAIYAEDAPQPISEAVSFAVRVIDVGRTKSADGA